MEKIIKENPDQVIAERTVRVAVSFFVCVTISVLDIIAIIILIVLNLGTEMIFLGVFIIIIIIPFLVIYFRAMLLPRYLIVKRKNSLIITGKKVLISDISDIKYETPHFNARSAALYGYGKIIFTLKNGKEIVVKYVANISGVGNLLSKIIYGNKNT